MRMCTYRVLATGRSEGLIEVVPNAHNVAAVLEDFPQVRTRCATRCSP